jgi:predicted Fe-Mo cluster-binding NifX family protein
MYMSLGKFRVAIPTKGQGGLEDVVSDVFGRANTFTIFDVEEEKIKNVKVLNNPAISYQHGRCSGKCSVIRGVRPRRFSTLGTT